MVRLDTDLEKYGRQNESFYFHTMQECKEFLYAFQDHWCNVPWKEPVEIPDTTVLPTGKARYMDIPPKTRADENLSWGFSLVRSLGIEDTAKQSQFIEQMISKEV